jgi:hypothetical protein
MNTTNIVLCVFYWIIFIVLSIIIYKVDFSCKSPLWFGCGLMIGAFFATIYSFGSMA